jgi:hypothetical protein
MERKLVRNKTEFIQLCKHWREVEGYYTCMREDDIAHPSEYPCMVMIEEQLSKDGSNWCNFHYVYKSDFDVCNEEIDDEESDDTVRLEDDFFDCDINDYKAIIGKCFRHDNIVLKVLGIRDDFDNKYINQVIMNQTFFMNSTSGIAVNGIFRNIYGFRRVFIVNMLLKVIKKNI